MPSALFFVGVNSEFKIQWQTAQCLQKNLGIQPLFCFNSSSHNLHEEALFCRRSGGECIELFPSKRGKYASSDLTTSRAEHRLAEGKTQVPPPFGKRLSKNRERISHFTELLKQHDVAIIFSSNSKLQFWVPHLMRSARSAGVPTVLLPFGFESLRSYAFKTLVPLVEKTGYSKLTSFILSLLLPKWSLRVNGARGVFVSLTDAAIHLLLRTTPPLPVSPYGGAVDYILAESDYMADHYRDLAPKSTKIINTGAIHDDLLWRAADVSGQARSRFCSNHGIDPGKPIILISLPQYMPALWTQVSDYPSYHEFLTDFFHSLSKYAGEFSICISVHPRMHLQPIQVESQRHVGIFLATDYVAEIIPLCAFYICCESSTCRLAIASNKPVINYDIYRFNFHHFGENQGMISVNTPGEFLRTLEMFCEQGPQFEDLGRRQAAVAAKFARLDGRAGERICEATTAILSLNHSEKKDLTCEN